jgi:HAD superfamily hydrolase (TIGR01509 family)
MAPHLQLDPQQVRAMSDHYLLDMYPGVVEMIDALNAAGFRTACLSNTNTNHWRLMNDRNSRSWLPLDRLTYRFASHLARQRKPQSQIYEHVERASGLSGPQIAFFDDVAENVEGARSRGWRAELILHDDDPMAQVRTHLTRFGILPSEKS